jgi:alpha-tubulin suppressor-like RCC1 family protein
VTDAIAIAAGDYHALALRSNGSVLAWGQNDAGQLAASSITGSLVPIPVSGLGGVTAIAAGTFHSIALKSDGNRGGVGRQ